MGLTDFFSDVMSSLSFTEVHAEAKDESEDQDEDKSEETESKEGEDAPEQIEEGGDDEEKEEEGGDDAAEEEEEEEEEEDEPEDIKPKLEEECARSAGCAPLKHHFDECVERVTAAQDGEEHHKAKGEDCVEEFFHLSHCASQCAATKLFASLK